MGFCGAGFDLVGACCGVGLVLDAWGLFGFEGWGNGWWGLNKREGFYAWGNGPLYSE